MASINSMEGYSPEKGTDFDDIIEAKAKEYGIPKEEWRRLIYFESRFNPNAENPSSHAIGLGQMMMDTAKSLKKNYNKPYEITRETLLDPLINLDLSATLFKENLNRANGNLACAYGMYNGGEWVKEAFDAKDYNFTAQSVNNRRTEWNKAHPNAKQKIMIGESSIEQARNYIEQLTGISLSTYNPSTYDTNQELLVREALEESSQNRILGVGAPQINWADPHYTYKPEGDPVNVGFIGGVKHSWIATVLKLGIGDKDPLSQKQYVPTSEEFMNIYRAVGNSFDRAEAVIRGASLPEDIPHRIDIINETQAYRMAEAKEGFSLSGIGSMLGDAGIDPLTYVPLGGQAKLAGRVIKGAFVGALSNQMNSYMSGTEADIINDMSIGAAYNLGFEIIGLGKGVVKTARKAQKIAEAQANNAPFPPDVVDERGMTNSLAWKLVKFADKMEGYLPAFSVYGALDRAENSTLKQLKEMMFLQRGAGKRAVGDEGTVFIDTRMQVQTAEEILNDSRKEMNDLYGHMYDSYDLLRRTGNTDADLDIAWMRAVEGKKTKFDSVPEFQNLVQRTKTILEKDAAILSDVAPDWGQGLANYFPRIFDVRHAADTVNEAMAKYGVSRKEAIRGLRTNLSKILVDDYKRNPVTKKAINDIYQKYVFEPKQKKAQKKGLKLDNPSEQAILEWVEKRAKDDVLGWLDQDKAVEKNIFHVNGEFKYNPLRPRMPWNMDALDEAGYSQLGLRARPMEALRRYHDQVTGMGIVNKMGYSDLDELKTVMDKAINEEFQNNPYPRIDKKELSRAVEMSINMIFGKSGKDFDTNSSWLAALSDIVTDLTYFTKGSRIGLLNLFEQTEAVKAYGASQFLRSIPGFNEFMQNATKGGMSNDDLRAIRNMVFGKNTRPYGLFRDIAQETWDMQLRRFNGNRAKAMLVSIPKTVTQWSPFSKFVTATEDSIISAAQDQFLGELVNAAHGRIKAKGLLDRKMLIRNGMNESSYNTLLKHIKEHSEMKPDGSWSLKDSFGSNAEALASIRRLGDWVANEVIQKNTLGDTYLWAGASSNPLMKMFFQFKTFALRSYQKRLRKMINRAAEGDALGQAYSLLIASGLGTLSVIANSYLDTLGMNEEQKKDYLKKNYDIESLSDATGESLVKLYTNGISRSAPLASAFLIANTLGYNGQLKTTATVGYGGATKDDYTGFDIDRLAWQMFPAYSTLRGTADIVGFTSNAVSHLGDPNYTVEDQEKNKERIYRALRNYTNVPWAKWAIYNAGVDKE